MNKESNVIKIGYSDIPTGHVATVVTCTEMLEKPELRRGDFPEGVYLEEINYNDLSRYRKLFSSVGKDWLWFSRMIMDDQQLSDIISDRAVEVYVLTSKGEDIGILELDYRVNGECELAFFGLTLQATGKGLGRALMNQAITKAWDKPISRFWVHTCTFDHPAALSFYIRSGFKPYAFQVEVAPDPRLTGHLSESAAPHVPLIKKENNC